MNRYAIPLFLMIISSAIFARYILPSYQDIKQQLAKEEEIKGYLVQAKEAQGKLDELKSQYKAFPVDADKKLNVLLPDSIDPLKLVIDVNNVAKRHGLEIISPAVARDAENPKSTVRFAKYTLKFKVTSTYPVFYELLADIQKSLALRDFSGVSFTAAPGPETASTVSRPEIALLDYQVELTSYALH